MMKLTLIGALTSRSSIYTYRLWECEKIESYDPFDANGSTIMYTTCGLHITKVGPVSSVRSSEWCTDKVRYYIDFLFIDRLYCILKVTYLLYDIWSSKIIINIFSLSLLHSLRYFNKFLHLYSILSNIMKYKLFNSFVYDYSGSFIDILTLNNFTKIISTHSYLLFLYKITYSLFYYIGIYNIHSILYSSNLNLILFSSLLNYNYPFLYLLFTNLNKKKLIIGVSQFIIYYLFHCGIGFLLMLRVFLLNIVNLYNNIYIFCYSDDGTQHLNNKFIGYIQLEYALSLLLFIFNQILFYFKTYFYCSNLIYSFLKLYIRYISFIVFLLSSLFFYNIFLNIFLNFDSFYSHKYIVFSFDYYNYYISSIFNISIHFTSYLSCILNIHDIVVPIKLFIESENFITSYKGFTDISSSISIQNFFHSLLLFLNIFLYTEIITIFNIFYISFLKYKFIKFTFFVYSLLLIFINMYYLCREHRYYIKLIILLLYLSLFTFYLNDYLYKNCVHMYTKFLFNYFIVNLYKLSLDSITYFLTGTVCRASKFISRYRTLGMYYLFTIV